MTEPRASIWQFQRTQTIHAEARSLEIREYLDNLSSDRAKADSVRGIDSRTYLIDYEASAQVWKYWLDAQLAPELRGSNVVHPWDCVDGYVDCFSKITHKYVINPLHRIVCPDAPHRIADPEEWRAHRDKALTMLQGVLDRGYGQSIHDVLHTTMDVFNELQFNHLYVGEVNIPPPQRQRKEK